MIVIIKVLLKDFCFRFGVFRFQIIDCLGSGLGLYTYGWSKQANLQSTAILGSSLIISSAAVELFA